MTSWYDVVESDSLRQSDIFRNVTGFWVPKDLSAADASPPPELSAKIPFARADFIITSASCDVAQPGYEYVLLNQVFAATEAMLRVDAKQLPKTLEAIRRGVIVTKFLLPATDAVSPVMPLSFVSSKMHVLLPITYLRALCGGPRLRLRAPMREVFGNWVGANFSRVGIEDDDQIERFTKQFSPAEILQALDHDL